ncbi:carbohydrate ABC transporter permease [Acidimangrovimonas sediminis]|uniref:carbohydrate ABC transporter permease n=1 Tax=Acidimangrovimonas sediminis TaxID=2056283 RepID=UPI0018EB9E54|nr:sugar ABC transporter permease [Acidimangrovimonas sediminis]
MSDTTTPEARPEAARPSGSLLRRALDRPNVLGPLLAAPATLILLILLAYPLGLGLWLSLTNTVLGGTPSFVGLANYAQLFHDPTYLAAAGYSVLYTVCSEGLKLTFGLGLALLLNRQFKGYRAARAIMLLPWVAPTVLSALAWNWLLDPQFSALSWLLIKLGLIHSNIDFLGQPWPARISLIIVNMWRGVPYFAMGYLAGLTAIPQSLIEAAQIDGAGPWTIFRRITWPLLLPVTTILLSFSTIWTVTDFQLIWTMTRGGPLDSTQVFTTLAYQRAINGGALGQGAAIAISVIPIMLILAIVALRSTREGK